jgi:hypothetical protein
MASKYVMSLYGGVEQQFDNVFKSNKQNQYTGNRLMPLDQMRGGKRNKTRAMKKKHKKTKNSRRRRKSKASKKNARSKKGGYWGEVVKQAVVPLALLSMQQTYRKKGKKTQKNKTRRRH